MPNTASKTGRGGRSRAAVNGHYLELLAEYRPVAIETEAENERALKIVETLMGRERLSAAERNLMKLLAVLIEDFEQRHYSLGDSSPLETLKELMRARGLEPKDLWPVFGSKGNTSEVLSGKRGISRERATRLGEKFSVSPAIFFI